MNVGIVAIAYLVLLLGCGGLALSQNRPWRMVFCEPVPEQVGIVRCLGWCCIFVSLGICVALDGIGFGVLLWPLLVAVAAFSVSMMIALMPAVFTPLKAVVQRLTK